ncbi:unnamed protein product [Rhizoctonia solani]|uniref:Zn(2)-C6 fungal-type domain-containing protein n=1 Tax=Rhizoctonia solani TaxID=456999 RepID=A0A8H3E9R3_9AGAM|nr:unnamed protein product [Rhizoctonia solani]
MDRDVAKWLVLPEIEERVPHMRKKCDEQRPVCLRCTRAGSKCIWPGQSELDIDSRTSDSTSSETNSENISPSFPRDSGPVRVTDYPTELGASQLQGAGEQGIDSSAVGGLRAHEYTVSAFLGEHAESSWCHSTSSDATPNLPKPVPPFWNVTYQPAAADLANDGTNDVSSRTLTHKRTLGTQMWEYSQDFGPRIIWPSRTTDDSDDYDPEGAMPLIRHSLATLWISNEPIFQEMLTFYSIFLARYVSDYALVNDVLLTRVRRRFAAADSLKHGMIGTALLFRANYEGSPSTNSLRNRSKEQYQLGMRALRLELESSYLSPWVKIAGLIELMNYEYCAGYLISYYSHLDQVATLVRTVMGSGAINFANLSGEQTFDVRLVAWYDILSSVALARPTLLEYGSDGQDMSRRDETLDPDRGIEWIVGYPDILLVFLARISNLRHAQLSPEQRSLRGAEIEQMVRGVQFSPVKAKSSTLRVARLAMQEACRHAVVLYLYHAIYRSDSSHPIVRDSVKTIIKIASTLKPGLNPDCFIPVPYFIAGTFAESERDRLFLRSRVLSCGNERYLRDLAATLDDLWKETDATGRLANWSGKQPPTFAF